MEDEARIKASIAAERERIVAGATREIAAAASAAQRELKRFVAELAVDRATKKLVLTADDDRALLQEFSHSLAADSAALRISPEKPAVASRSKVGENV